MSAALRAVPKRPETSTERMDRFERRITTFVDDAAAQITAARAERDAAIQKLERYEAQVRDTAMVEFLDKVGFYRGDFTVGEEEDCDYAPGSAVEQGAIDRGLVEVTPVPADPPFRRLDLTDAGERFLDAQPRSWRVNRLEDYVAELEALLT